MNRFIFEQQWTDAGKLTEADFSKLYLSQPQKIGPALTFMMGRDNVSLAPISMMTEGKGAILQEIEGMEYEYNVVQSFSKTVALAETVSTTKAGLGFSTFKLKFKEKHFARDYTIFSPNKYRLRIVNDPVQDGSLWIYEVQLMGTGDPAAYVPASELVAGTFFTKGYATVAAWDSVGNDSNIVGYSKVRGNISLIRKSFKWAGTVMHRDMTVDLSAIGGGKMFWNYQQWQIERQWQQEVENYYWYSKSNRSANGKFNQLDSNNNPVIEGDGLLAQIGNKDTYGVLTLTKLKNVIRDAYTGMKDAQNKEITLMTGIGGAEAFDEAVRNGVLGSGFTTVSDSKFIKGEGRALRSTGFFTEYDHIDGFKVKVQTVDVFDFGEIAQNTPLHPTSGLPLESHRMVFLDTSTYDGMPNIMGIVDKNRKFSRTAVLGVGPVPPGFPDTPNRASDRDAASIHYMKSCGVVMRRFNTSIDLECVLS